MFLPTVSKFHLTPEVYAKMYGILMNSIGMEIADASTKNCSRWYFPSLGAQYWYNPNKDAELLDIRPYIPDTTQRRDGEINLNNYDSVCEYNDDADVNQKRLYGMTRWALSQCSAGNRNDTLFAFGCFVKDLQMDFETKIREMNNVISDPLPESEIASITRSVMRK